VTISPEEAMAELQQYEQRIKEGGVAETFPVCAKERSDCSSYVRNGDLGHFGRGEMQRPFEDASFGLNVGEMSGIVDTDSGLHLIYRIE